jgi:hypothetical protein
MFFRAIAAFLLLTLTSCNDDYLIKAYKSGSSIEFHFYEDGFFQDERVRVCLSSLNVVEGAPGGKPIWSIESPANNCVLTKAIVLGNVPSGMSQIGPFVKPQLDLRYSLWLVDSHHRMGGSESWIPEKLPASNFGA